jgi:hypothetical protein
MPNKGCRHPTVGRLPTVTAKGCGYRIGALNQAPKDTRSAADKARDAAGIVASPAISRQTMRCVT